MFRWTVHLDGGRTNLWPSVAVAAEHNVFVFGGICRDVCQDVWQMDVRIFNTVSLRWRNVTSKPGGPSYRDGHTAVLMEDVIYVWGGTYGKEYCNVLFAFNVDTHRWVRTKASGNVPLGRRGHAACVLEKVMYVHGGHRFWRDSRNDIYKLDSATMVWALVETRGTPPQPSSAPTATIIGTRMYVFGGTESTAGGAGDYYNTISVLDTETSRWLSTPPAQLLPAGRWHHSAFSHKGELYIFGGHAWEEGVLTFNDLWKYNLKSSWKQVKPKGRPPSWYSSCCCTVGDQVFVFATTIQPAYYPFILDLNPRLKTLCKLAFIQYDLEQSELTHDLRWELAAMTTDSHDSNGANGTHVHQGPAPKRHRRGRGKKKKKTL